MQLGINVDGSPCKLCKKKSELCHIHSKKQLIKSVNLKHSNKVSRCWKGYEPVPGKTPYSKGSCRKI